MHSMCEKLGINSDTVTVLLQVLVPQGAAAGTVLDVPLVPSQYGTDLQVPNTETT